MIPSLNTGHFSPIICYLDFNHSKTSRTFNYFPSDSNNQSCLRVYNQLKCPSTVNKKTGTKRKMPKTMRPIESEFPRGREAWKILFFKNLLGDSNYQ